MLSCRKTVGEGGDVTGTVLEPGLSPSPPALPPSSVIERDGNARTITQLLTRGSPKRVLKQKKEKEKPYTRAYD